MSEHQPSKTSAEVGENHQPSKTSKTSKPSKGEGLGTILVDLLSHDEGSCSKEEFSSSEDESEDENEDERVVCRDFSCCGYDSDPRLFAFNKLVDTHDKLVRAFLVMVLDD